MVFKLECLTDSFSHTNSYSKESVLVLKDTLFFPFFKKVKKAKKSDFHLFFFKSLKIQKTKKEPSQPFFQKKLTILTQFFNLDSLLLHRISVPERHGAVFFTLVIDSHAIRSSDFILSSISFSDRSTIIIFTFANLTQITENLLSNLNLFLILFDQRENRKFDRSQLFWKSDYHARSSIFKLLFIIKFEHCHHHLTP